MSALQPVIDELARQYGDRLHGVWERPGGRYAAVVENTFDAAIVEGPCDRLGTYDRRWDYPSWNAASRAMIVWLADADAPDGWTRAIGEIGVAIEPQMRGRL